ncbi:ketopantoate reductase family protein [Paludibaculum fermentans]|uniref:2-dehydropantoate 2-reductase n=1 Tax=Paludibaculum fermentans TaxID=1473598 RepID=A0A7S7NSW3_PALFE|nr:2-dehydropantoate 2-reductase [Paludibaculum fermentans]QOY89180.1 2-dehydropantoate 2-reductase [Paludibaculum fermentans]
MRTTEDFPPVVVVGAGAVGCYFGGMLARSGVRVTLIGRSSHVNAIHREGVFLDALHVKARIPLAATTSMEEGLHGAGVILFCVKSGSTESTAREMQPFLPQGATILSFQNGVDNPARIHSAIQAYPIPVAVYVAAEMTAPGRVTHTGRGDLIIGHQAGWPQRPALEPLATMFEQAEIPCRISSNIAADLWAKMVMNCAYNAISALTRSQYGRMVQSEPVRAFGLRVIAETVAVARAEGVLLEEQPMIDAALGLAEKMTRATSSMAQDLARARPTEIDSLNGYVVRRGQALGVATPASELLVAMIQLLEESVLASAPRTN